MDIFKPNEPFLELRNWFKKYNASIYVNPNYDLIINLDDKIFYPTSSSRILNDKTKYNDINDKN